MTNENFLKYYVGTQGEYNETLCFASIDGRKMATITPYTAACCDVLFYTKDARYTRGYRVTGRQLTATAAGAAVIAHVA